MDAIATEATTAIVLSSLIAARIIAVHRCGHNTDGSSQLLSGVYIACKPGVDGMPPTIAIAATDGKLLIEEVWFIAESYAADWSVLLARDSVARLAKWLSSLPKLRKGHHAITLDRLPSVDGHRSVHFSADGSTVTLPCINGTFPNYGPAFAGEAKADEVSRYGLNLHYLRRLSACWDNATIKVETKKGLVFSPLRFDDKSIRRALLMKISLPAVA